HRLCFLYFFFSSRRRHTRSKRDWSSDVCSSDLLTPSRYSRELQDRLHDQNPWKRGRCLLRENNGKVSAVVVQDSAARCAHEEIRSEERRVGKERRSRWSREDRKEETQIRW